MVGVLLCAAGALGTLSRGAALAAGGRRRWCSCSCAPRHRRRRGGDPPLDLVLGAAGRDRGTGGRRRRVALGSRAARGEVPAQRGHLGRPLPALAGQPAGPVRAPVRDRARRLRASLPDLPHRPGRAPAAGSRSSRTSRSSSSSSRAGWCSGQSPRRARSSSSGAWSAATGGATSSRRAVRSASGRRAHPQPARLRPRDAGRAASVHGAARRSCSGGRARSERRGGPRRTYAGPSPRRSPPCSSARARWPTQQRRLRYRSSRTRPTPASAASSSSRAQQPHPVDYFFALATPASSRCGPAADGVSPRLHALNRALRLCPSCELVHVEVARSLWQLALRAQALLEWREAVRPAAGVLQPRSVSCSRRAPSPSSWRRSPPSTPTAWSRWRTSSSASDASTTRFTVLDQADAMGASPAESLLVRGRAADSDQPPRGRAVDAGRGARRRDSGSPPRSARRPGDAGEPGRGRRRRRRFRSSRPAPRAILKTSRSNACACASSWSYQKWKAATRALDGLKMALYAANGYAGEAHVAAARIQGRLSRWNNALNEYRIALADTPSRRLPLDRVRARRRAGRSRRHRARGLRRGRASQPFQRRGARGAAADRRAAGTAAQRARRLPGRVGYPHSMSTPRVLRAPV